MRLLSIAGWLKLRECGTVRLILFLLCYHRLACHHLACWLTRKHRPYQHGSMLAGRRTTQVAC